MRPTAITTDSVADVSALHCREAIVGNVPVLMVSGEIDLATIPQLRDALTSLVSAQPTSIVAVDLDGVTVLDDTGLGSLLGAAAQARELDGDLVLVCTDERLRLRFARSGLDRALQVRDRLAS